jgi:glutamate/tyrosine decarboxylase-like PLP-dependent enzyme
MTERSEDWNVGLAQDLQDDEFVLEFVTAADRLRAEPRIQILNDVVLNQVLVRVIPSTGDADAATRDVLKRVQDERVCWLGGTRWHGMDAMRISVSNWSTTDEDVDRSADSILRAVRA